MSDQHTKVTYTAVSKFSSLQGDLDKLLVTLEAIKKAEKDIGKGGNRRGPNADKNSSSGGSTTTSKSAEANEKRRIARYDSAQRIAQSKDRRHQRSLDQALTRRNRAATQAQKILAAQENRQERAKDQALARRNKKANAELSNQIAKDRQAQQILDRAQRRRDKAADEAQSERLRKERHEADLVRAAEKAQFQEDIKAEAAFNAKERAADTSAHRRDLREEDEAQRARHVKERQQAAQLAAADKKSASELARKILVARAALDSANREALDANRFTSRKIQARSVDPVKVNFDADKHRNYYQSEVEAREVELRQIERSTAAIHREMDARGALYNILRKIAPAARESGSSLSSSFRGTNRDIRQTNGLLTNLSRNLDSIGRWRPRLIPPFIALVPIIGALLGLMNPLVAGLGAVGVAAIGMAGSLGSLAGAALGAIPALASLLSLGAALKMAFGGVGKALKAAGKANGTSGSGVPSGSAAPTKEELTQVEKIARAQEAYRRSIEDVADATNDLDEAKKNYLARLKEIEKQLERIRNSEARAAANAQLAQENYWNVMADSGSTKGQKMDAFVGMSEANQEMEDLKTEAQDLRDELAELKKTGVDGDKAVRDASRRLTDAIYAQRDAQIALANAYKDTGDAAGTNGGAASAIEEFDDAMSKLSPSAQAVVLALLAMQPAWEAVKRSVQESFFSEIVSDIQLLVRLFPTLENLLGKTAGAFGRVASRGLKLVTSDKWLRDLNILAEANVPLVENMGDGLLSILDTIRDLTIALLPFAEAMSQGFKEGADNFALMVANARETGSLAAWMEVVQGRLEQWWRIIKNVSATLYNYSAAAAPFGQWLTDGLEEITKGWREASQAAREDGSPFQVYLENVKPALTALKEMFAEFFGWFARESANVDNIEAFTRIIDTITNELGPALARIFDVMSETGVGESLLDAVVQIVDTLADFLEKGGAEGIKTFFETVNELFSLFADVIDRLPPDAIKGIASALMTISALRFFGITKLVSLLLTLVSSKGLPKLKDLFNSMKGVNGVPAPTTPSTGAGTAAAGGAAAKGGKLLPILGKAGVIGAIAAAAADTLASGWNLWGTVTDPESTPKEITSSARQFMTSGATRATPIGSLLGAGSDIATLLGIDVDSWFVETSNRINNWATEIRNKGIDIWEGFKNLPTWLQEQWDNSLAWIQNLPTKLGEESGELWAKVRNFSDWLQEQWDNAIIWLQGLPALVGEQLGELWSEVETFPYWLAEQWGIAVVWLQGLPTRIRDAVLDLWSKLTTFGEWLAHGWGIAVVWLQGLPTRIRDAAIDLWSELPSIATWLAEQSATLITWVKNLPNTILEGIGGVAEDFMGGFQKGYEKNRIPSGMGGGGGGRMSGMVKGAGGSGTSSAAGTSSIWAQIFGDPIAWLEEKWAAIPGWLAEKTSEMSMSITNTATLMTTVWTLMWTVIVGTMTEAYEQNIKPTIDKLAATFFWLRDSVINPVWTGIKTIVYNAWVLGVLPVLSTMNNWVRTKPKEAFEAARDGIANAWNGIKDLAKAPVRFVVDVVIGGLVDAVNSIKGVSVAKPRLPAGFHDGGYTGNMPARAIAGVVHGDEHVIRAQARQKIERSNPGLLDHMNTFGEVPGYRSGGLVNPLPAGSYSVSQPYHAGHNGIDLAAASGTKVYATGAGVVQMAQAVNMGGNEVYIQHDNGLGTRYSHLSAFASRPGDRVQAGNIIGYVGSTGMSTGPHLHYMVHNPGGGPNNYGNHTNPAGWMNGNAQELGEAWNPLTGLADFVSSKISEKFPGGGMWVDAAAGLVKAAVPQIVSHYTPMIGKDNNGHTLFDKGGWWNGDQMPVSKLNQPEAILTTPQWETMHRLSGMMTSAFAGVGTTGTSANFAGVPTISAPRNAQTSAPVDNSITIEKLEVNNPVGETTDESVANTIRDMTYLRS